MGTSKIVFRNVFDGDGMVPVGETYELVYRHLARI